ncbi:MAG: DUF937 domain-containing protein, partial [Saprospiraceae bacterium]|nr:DUF937 domain-containing protein [Saprospiraceae bacterium]
PEDDTKAALTSILPAILGGLVDKGVQKDGTTSIFDFIKNEKIDGSIFDNLSDALGGGKATDGLLEEGSGMLDFIFDNKNTSQNGIVDLVTASAGIGRGSCNSLLKLTTPLVMGLIGRQVKSQALDVAAFRDFLNGQKEYLQKAAPAGFFDKLNFSSLSSGSANEEETKEEEQTEETPGSANTLMSRIGPWLLLGSLALGLLYIMRSCGGRAPDESAVMSEEKMEAGSMQTGIVAGVTEEDSIVEVTRPEVGAKETMRRVVDGVAIINLPGGKELNVRAGSFIDRVCTASNDEVVDQDTRYTFDNLRYLGGTAIIDPSSEPQLQSMAIVLQAFPALDVGIEAYTKGDITESKNLAEQRALAIKKALEHLGVANERLTAEGFGEEASSDELDTSTGETANYRVDLYLKKK